MRPAFGNDEETTPEKAPAKKSAAKKATKDVAVGKEALPVETADATPAKRTRRSPEQMAEARGESGKPTQTAAQLRKAADRAIQIADRAEHRELLTEAKNDVRFQESLIKEHQKGLDKATKELEKSKARLAKLEGPGQ